MAVTNGWGQAAKNNTNGFGKLATNNIGAGSIYENSYSGDTALIGTSAAFAYGKSSFNQGEADPTPTITGTAGGSFNADAGVVFVDTGSFNSSTGQIDLSATTIDNHIITYTVDGVQSGQTVGVTAAPYSSTRSFSFDGVNDYFEIQNSPLDVLSSVNQISISFWYNTSVTSFGFVFGQKTSASFELYKSSSWFMSLSGNVVFSSGNPPVILNEWVNVIIVIDKTLSTGGITFYQNSVSGGNQSYIGNAAGTPNFFNVPLNIGRRANNTYFYTGNIDEFSVWNTALSSDAVTEIAAGPSELTSLTNASSSNLKAWYKMGE